MHATLVAPHSKCAFFVYEQELADRLAAGVEAIYEGLPDVAAAAPAASTAATSASRSSSSSVQSVPAVQLLQVDPSQALKQLVCALRI
jgi:hypothetical protein